jgi:hypothetical protein
MNSDVPGSDGSVGDNSFMNLESEPSAVASTTKDVDISSNLSALVPSEKTSTTSDEELATVKEKKVFLTPLSDNISAPSDSLLCVSHAAKSKSTSDVSAMLAPRVAAHTMGSEKVPSTAAPPAVILTSPSKGDEKRKQERQKEKKTKRRPNIAQVMFGEFTKEAKELPSTSSALDKIRSDLPADIAEKKLFKSRSITLDIESILSPLLNVRDHQRRTALHCACMSSSHSVSLVSTLVDNGALKSPVDIRGRTPLYYAAYCQNLLILSYLLELLGREEQVKCDEFGFTPLHVTCGKGWVQGLLIFMKKTVFVKILISNTPP